MAGAAPDARLAGAGRVRLRLPRGPDTGPADLQGAGHRPVVGPPHRDHDGALGIPRAPSVAGSAGEEAVRADLGEFFLERSLVEAVGEAGLELAERLHGQERVGLLRDR